MISFRISIIGGLPLLCRGLSLYSSFAAVVAHMACLVVNGRPVRVGGMNVYQAYVAHCRIIRELSLLPATSAVATAPIPIIDAAIITNSRSPVTRTIA